MYNTVSGLRDFINEHNTINNVIIKKLVLVANEYVNITEKYSNSETIPQINKLINKFTDELEKTLTELNDYLEEHPLNNIDNEEYTIEDNTLSDMLKLFANKLIEQISKIQKQELITEGLEIMMKQTVINKDMATQLLIENNYDPVSALLAYMNYKDKPDAATYFTFQLNQHELINELVKLSDGLISSTYTTDSLSEQSMNKVQSYVCVLINNNNDLRKIKKYSTTRELYELFISDDISTITVHSFVINNERFGLLVNKDSITSNPNNSLFVVNNPTTIILRNMEIIEKTEFYCGPSLFINNFFLN